MGALDLVLYHSNAKKFLCCDIWQEENQGLDVTQDSEVKNKLNRQGRKKELSRLSLNINFFRDKQIKDKRDKKMSEDVHTPDKAIQEYFSENTPEGTQKKFFENQVSASSGYGKKNFKKNASLTQEEKSQIVSSIANLKGKSADLK
jgi:hypothetical protein